MNTDQGTSTTLKWFTSSYSSGEGGECVEVAMDWRKSSHSDGEGGNCVEVAMDWRKSSHSSGEGGACLEFAACPQGVHVRDSKDRRRPHLSFAPSAWSAFLAHAATHA